MADVSTRDLTSPQSRLPASILGFAILQLGVILLPPVSVTPFGLEPSIPIGWLAELLLLLGLIGTLLPGPRAVLSAVVGGVTLLSLAGLGYMSWVATDRLWLVAVVLVLAAGTLSYALHRYERVSLGLVEGESV